MSQEEIDTSLSEFRELATRGHPAIERNNLHFYASHSSDSSQLIFVYFSDEKNVGVTTMRKFLQQLEDKNIGKGIIIYQDKMTPSAHKVGWVESLQCNGLSEEQSRSRKVACHRSLMR